MRSLRRTTWAFALLLLAQSFCAAQFTLPPTALHWSPEELEVGSPVLFQITLPHATAVTGTWQQHDLHFFRDPAGNIWFALAGIDVGAEPGTYPVSIQTTLESGENQTLRKDIAVGPAPYDQITLQVPEKFVAPNAAALKVIAADRVLKDRAFAHAAPNPLWSGAFRPPLHPAPRSDSFGTRRIFNGTLASVHRGLDYHAKTGTPVTAINSGRVILARPLYYEGNCVIIDHGAGLASVYMHLSHFNVAEGTLVRKGQLIALSGATGRATGPHLHLGIRWQGTNLDAAKLFKLDLPTTPTERPSAHSRTAKKHGSG